MILVGDSLGDLLSPVPVGFTVGSHVTFVGACVGTLVVVVVGVVVGLSVRNEGAVVG